MIGSDTMNSSSEALSWAVACRNIANGTDSLEHRSPAHQLFLSTFIAAISSLSSESLKCASADANLLVSAVGSPHARVTAETMALAYADLLSSLAHHPPMAITRRWVEKEALAIKLLRFVAKSAEVSSTEIRKHLDIKKAHLSNLIAMLVEYGYVFRRRDGVGTHVSITPSGLKLVEGAPSRRRQLREAKKPKVKDLLISYRYEDQRTRPMPFAREMRVLNGTHATVRGVACGP